MKIKKDFIGMFDVLKGILMIAIITIHTLGFVNDTLPQDRAVSFCTELYRFGGVVVALFFVLAGYSFKPAKDIGKYIKKQAKEFLLPYAAAVLLTCACIAARGVLCGTFSFGSVSSVLFAGLFGATGSFELGGVWFASIVALWFPLAFFLSGTFYQLIRRIKNEKLVQALIWTLTALCVLVPQEIARYVPWTLVQSLAVLGFIEVGRLLKKHKLLYQKFPIPAVLAALAAWVALHVFSACSIGVNLYRFWWLDYSVIAAVSAVFLKGYLTSGMATAEFLSPLEYIGRNSMWILYIHAFELLAFPWDAGLAALFPKSIPPFGVFLIVNAARLTLDVLLCACFNGLYGYLINRKLMKKEI